MTSLLVVILASAVSVGAARPLSPYAEWSATPLAYYSGMAQPQGGGVQPAPLPAPDASQSDRSGMNAGGWANLIWAGLIGLVLVALLIVAGLGLRGPNIKE